MIMDLFCGFLGALSAWAVVKGFSHD